MDRIDWSSAPESAIYERLADTTSRPPPPPPLPFLSTWPEFPTQPQPVQSGDYDEFLSQGAAPYTMAAPTTGCGICVFHYPACPNVNFFPLSFTQTLLFFSCRKQKKRRQKEEKEAYVTKPPNAFMLFMKEQRPNVGPQVRCKGSAAVNAFLGQKWKSLSEQAQAKYYDEAERLRLLHKQQHPEWSNRENYVKNPRRHRENMQTPHRNALTRNPTQDLLAVRRQR
uniref:HMG box domain-containing protein n=1 Tax=Mola mola TaxID=94237 RepID=A0A3Q3WAA4_MOLML